MNTTPDRLLPGMLLGLLAYSLLSMHDATNKYLVAFLPVWQVLFFRSTSVVIAVLIIGRGKLVTAAIATPMKRALLGRGALTLCAWLAFFTAARTLPLAQLLTLSFSAPLITTLLAVKLLGERVSGIRWATLLIGFLGVLLAGDPRGTSVSPATFLVLAAAAMWGYAIVLMRQIARREASLTQMLYQNTCFMLVTGLLSVATWVPPTPFQLALLALAGLLGGLGQFTMFEAVRHAPAAVMATVEYSTLLWAFLLGWLAFGEVPPPPVWAGAGLILVAGIFLVLAERRAGRR